MKIELDPSIYKRLRLGGTIGGTLGWTSSTSPTTANPTSSHNKVELCQFTPALKAELFPRLRVAFEQRLLRIPISREIREDLHAIQRSVSQFGQISYRAPQSPDGHSDRTTALSLALRAATSAPPSGGATTIWVPGRTADLRWIPRRPRGWRRR